MRLDLYDAFTALARRGLIAQAERSCLDTAIGGRSCRRPRKTP